MYSAKLKSFSAKIEIFETVIVFYFDPSWSFLAQVFRDRIGSMVANGAPEKPERLNPLFCALGQKFDCDFWSYIQREMTP